MLTCFLQNNIEQKPNISRLVMFDLELERTEGEGGRKGVIFIAPALPYKNCEMMMGNL